MSYLLLSELGRHKTAIRRLSYPSSTGTFRIFSWRNSYCSKKDSTRPRKRYSAALKALDLEAEDNPVFETLTEIYGSEEG